MPPRLSLRRAFLCVLCCGGALILVSLQHNWSWSPIQSIVNPSAHEDLDLLRTEPVEVQEVAEGVKEIPTEVPRDLTKAWFFREGTQFPDNFRGMPKLFPDENDGDRVVEQLMYVPHNYQGKKHTVLISQHRNTESIARNVNAIKTAAFSVQNMNFFA